MRGFDKVRGEWSLMVLCYNFTRVLSVIGFDRFIAGVAECSPMRATSLLVTAMVAIGRIIARAYGMCTAPSRLAAGRRSKQATCL